MQADDLPYEIHHSGPERFTLTPDDPSETVITDARGTQLYTVKTLRHQGFSDKTITSVRTEGNGGADVALLEWHNHLADRVTFGGKRGVAMSSWMRKLSNKGEIAFQDERGRKYTWKGVAPFKIPELYAEDYGDALPIVKWLQPVREHKPVRHERPMAHSVLLLTPRALEIRDLAVVSFLFLEKARRDHELTMIEKGQTEEESWTWNAITYFFEAISSSP